MITHTSNQRAQFPKRYLKKDARTKILRLVYGRANFDGSRQGAPDPSLNQWRADHADIRVLMSTAEWPAEKRSQIYDDHQKLKPKPVQAQAQAQAQLQEAA